MAIIHVLMSVPTVTGAVAPAKGTLRFTPMARHIVVGSPDNIVVPVPFIATLVDGAVDVTIATGDPSLVWKVDERISGLASRTVYYQIPDAPEVDYPDLTPIDPVTLEPTAVPPAAWYAYVETLQASVGPQGPAGADSTVPGPQGEIGPEGPQGIQGEVGPEGPIVDGNTVYRGEWVPGPGGSDLTLDFSDGLIPADWNAQAGCEIVAYEGGSRFKFGAADAESWESELTFKVQGPGTFQLRYILAAKTPAPEYQGTLDDIYRDLYGAVSHSDSGYWGEGLATAWNSPGEDAGVWVESLPDALEYDVTLSFGADPSIPLLETAYIEWVLIPDTVNSTYDPYKRGELVTHKGVEYLAYAENMVLPTKKGSTAWAPVNEVIPLPDKLVHGFTHFNTWIPWGYGTPKTWAAGQALPDWADLNGLPVVADALAAGGQSVEMTPEQRFEVTVMAPAKVMFRFRQVDPAGQTSAQTSDGSMRGMSSKAPAWQEGGIAIEGTGIKTASFIPFSGTAWLESVKVSDSAEDNPQPPPIFLQGDLYTDSQGEMFVMGGLLDDLLPPGQSTSWKSVAGEHRFRVSEYTNTSPDGTEAGYIRWGYYGLIQGKAAYQGGPGRLWAKTWSEGEKTGWASVTASTGYLTKTANYTLLPPDEMVIFNGAALTATLPDPTAHVNKGRIYRLKNINASALTVVTAGAAKQIDGAANKSLPQWADLTVISDGVRWLSSTGLYNGTNTATKTASYTILATDELVIFNGASLTATLPDPTGSSVKGRTYRVKNINATALTVASAGAAKTIDGAANKSLAQWERIEILSDGAQWLTV